MVIAHPIFYLIARWYFDDLYELKLLSHYVRLETGTVTTLAIIHPYLQRQQWDIDTNDESCDTVIYGPSNLTKQSKY